MASDKIGAIWKSKYGGFTGKLEIDGKKIDIIVFENKKKTLDKHPDYDICIRRPRLGGVESEDVPF